MGSDGGDGEEPLRSWQEIGVVPPSPSPQAIFYDGSNRKRERIVSFPPSTLWFINSLTLPIKIGLFFMERNFYICLFFIL